MCQTYSDFVYHFIYEVVGKIRAIPKLLALNMKFLLRDKTNNMLLHTHLLQEASTSGFVFQAANATYHFFWAFDTNVSTIISRDRLKFEVFKSIVLSMAEENWMEQSTGRTVIHSLLHECRSRLLSENHTVKLCDALLNKFPELGDIKDCAGETPAEIAASCVHAPRVQSIFLKGIICALKRKGLEIDSLQSSLTSHKRQSQEMKIELEERYYSVKNRLEGDLKDTKYVVEELRRENDSSRLLIASLTKQLENLLSPEASMPDRDEIVDQNLDEVEIECDVITIDMKSYLYDPRSTKVYSNDDTGDFIGKLLDNGEIDLDAVDSEEDI